MGDRTSYANGVPCWVDLATTDPAAARTFYGGLFGWTFQIGPDEAGNYTFAQVGGKTVAGLGGQPVPDTVPTAWTTYFATSDLDGTTGRITAGGGGLTMDPLDVMDQGRVAIAIDPGGASFGLWQAGKHIGASLVNEPGAVVWNQLDCRDLDAATAFYGPVLGVTFQPVDTQGGPRYETFHVGDQVAGGMLQMDDSFPPDLGPNWATYFEVEDANAAVAKATELGGSVLKPLADSPFGTWAVLSDPQGAVFLVIKSIERQP